MDDQDPDEEGWHDDDDPDDAETAPCPECGRPIHDLTDKCPACGYWLSEADRSAMWSGMGKPAWIKITAAVVLVAIVASLLAAGAAFF
jgi:ribosomal protein L37E